MKKNKEFINFIFSGIFNTIIGYSVFVLLYWYFQNKEIAVTIGSVIGVVVAYNVHNKYVFNSNASNKFKKYLVVHFSCYLLNLTLLEIMVSYVKLNVYFSQLVVIGIIIIVKFIVNKKFVFNTTGTEV